MATGRVRHLPSVVATHSISCLLHPVPGLHEFVVLLKMTTLLCDVVATVANPKISAAIHKCQI